MLGCHIPFQVLSQRRHWGNEGKSFSHTYARIARTYSPFPLSVIFDLFVFPLLSPLTRDIAFSPRSSCKFTRTRSSCFSSLPSSSRPPPAKAFFASVRRRKNRKCKYGILLRVEALGVRHKEEEEEKAWQIAACCKRQTQS